MSSAPISPGKWMAGQIARHGLCRYVPFKRNIFQTTWGIIDNDTSNMVVEDGLLLGIARARCNNMNRSVATT